MKPHLTVPLSLRLVLAGALCVGASLLTSGCSSVGAASGAPLGVRTGFPSSNTPTPDSAPGRPTVTCL